MKKGWKTIELAAVSSINYGYTTSASSEPIGPRFLRITDIQNERVDWNAVPYCKIEFSDLPKFRLASGDIVFARTGATTGKSFLVEDPPDAVFASYLIRLRLLDEILLPQFVLKYFQTADYWQSIKDGSSGSTQGGFNATKLGALKIPVPPLPEQQRIVALLDEAFASLATAKANAERNLENARALFDSHLQAVFTHGEDAWPTKPLGEVCNFQGGSQPPKSQFIFTPKDGYVRFLQIRDFDSDKHTTFIPDSTKNRLCMESDIMIGRYGASVGKILTGKAGAYNVALIKTIPDKKKLDADFFYHYLLSPSFQDRLASVAARSAQNGFSKDDIFDFPIPTPSLEAQAKVIEQMGPLAEETQHLTRLYERKLAALEKLKKALLHQAFNGEL